MLLYLNKIKMQKQIKRFKNRKQQKLSFNYNLFTSVLPFFSRNRYSYIFNRFLLFIELKLYRFYFLKLRRFCKKKKIKSYVYICCNHNFSRKSKNSRMGKGKGKFVRFVFRSKILKPIFILKGISKIRISKFIIFLNKKTNNKYFCF
jgi:hypothetical protein